MEEKQKRTDTSKPTFTYSLARTLLTTLVSLVICTTGLNSTGSAKPLSSPANIDRSVLLSGDQHATSLTSTKLGANTQWRLATRTSEATQSDCAHRTVFLGSSTSRSHFQATDWLDSSHAPIMFAFSRLSGLSISVITFEPLYTRASESERAR